MTPTFDDVLRWVNGREPESEVLGFKEAFWPEKSKRPRGEEIAKDLAAFMNLAGGVIVVGVVEQAGRAAGFSSATLPAGADQTAQQAARNHIVPAEAAAGVHLRREAHDEGGASRDLLILEVDPWPHGPVGVRTGDEPTKYWFPVRRGTHTEELTWEDAMRRVDAAHRRVWLQFRDWHRRHKSLDVYVGSDVLAVFDGKTLALPVVADEPFATLAQVTDDVFVLQMIRTTYARWFSTDRTLAKMIGMDLSMADSDKRGWNFVREGIARAQWNNTNEAATFPVPLSLVRSAWLEDTTPPRLHVHLDGAPLFTGQSWVMRSISRA